MTEFNTDENARKPWIEPEVSELSVAETSAFIGRGADVPGNPSIDCQLS